MAKKANSRKGAGRARKPAKAAKKTARPSKPAMQRAKSGAGPAGPTNDPLRASLYELRSRMSSR